MTRLDIIAPRRVATYTVPVLILPKWMSETEFEAHVRERCWKLHRKYINMLWQGYRFDKVDHEKFTCREYLYQALTYGIIHTYVPALQEFTIDIYLIDREAHIYRTRLALGDFDEEVWYTVRTDREFDHEHAHLLLKSRQVHDVIRDILENDTAGLEYDVEILTERDPKYRTYINILDLYIGELAQYVDYCRLVSIV